MITLPSQLSMLSIPSIGLDFHSKGFGNEYKAIFRISATRLKTTMVLPILATKKKVWVWTKNKDVMTASVERGWDTFIFTPDTHGLIKEWSEIAKIRALVLEDGVIRDSENHQIGLFSEVSSAHELKDVEALAGQTDTVVMDALDWQIIPAENMVAAFQNSRTSLLATARTVDEARVYIEALEKGTDGVVLQTENPMDVFELKAHFASNGEKTKDLSIATIHRIELMGLGDRVCVDLCNLLAPGEGLLVGSFAKGLFLVHSECLETNYIASRPFRVNAGPVHAYVEMPGGRTCYLSELCSGMEVLVTNNEGRQRRAMVGRVKIESRPLILIEAKVENSDILYSLLLQNAETVSLVKPSSSSGNGSGCAAPVTSLKVGDKVLLSVEEEGARHTGRKIQEFIVEK